MTSEVWGYLDVKISSIGRKFGHWKTWRRYWCVAKRGRGNCVQLEIGSGTPINSFSVPNTSILARSESRSREFAFGIYVGSTCRCGMVFLAGSTESESQRWINGIRNMLHPPLYPVGEDEFSISVIDRHQVKFSFDRGMYGTLKFGATGLILRDPHSGKIRTQWKWHQLISCSIKEYKNLEDRNKVLIINTTSEMRDTESRLEIFCPNANELERKLKWYLRPRLQKRLMTSPLPPTPALDNKRRLSRSEGDLFSLFTMSGKLNKRSYAKSPISRLPTFFEDESILKKIAPILISTGMGLILATPGCSEPDSLHNYECLQNGLSATKKNDDNPNGEDDVLTPLNTSFEEYVVTSRRVSGISIQSGIYEEIDEQSQGNTMSNIFLPPPLPPRTSDLQSDNHEAKGSNTITYSNQTELQPWLEPCTESDYLPMAPRKTQDECYVTMASIPTKLLV